MIPIHKCDESKGVSTDVSPHFPEVGANELLKKLGGGARMLLDQLKNPRDLARLLAVQRFKKSPDGTIPGTRLVELDGTHYLKVSIYANPVKTNLKSPMQQNLTNDYFRASIMPLSKICRFRKLLLKNAL